MPVYWDSVVHRMRKPNGRFTASSPTPDETCPNGCERWGDWWVPADCPKHLLGDSR